MFDSLFDFESDDEFGYVDDSERLRRDKADLISETIGVARDLIDVDLMPKIKDSKIYTDLEKYLIGFNHMNLYKYGWRIQFGTSKQWAGLCSAQDREKHGSHLGISKDRNIYLSIDFVKHDNNWRENMIDVIYHEMAHAVVQEIFYFKDRGSILNQIDPSNKPSEGHGIIWENICVAINKDADFGKVGSRNSVCEKFYRNANMADSIKNFKYRCFNCSHVGYGVYKDFTETCSNCGKSVIVERN
jgi:hypothetical protein